MTIKDLDLIEKEHGNINVYIAEVVKFHSEYRLLVGNGKLYGCGYIEGEDIIPQSFIETIVKKVTPENPDSDYPKFCGVDVGLLRFTQSYPVKEYDLPPTNLPPKWVVVEINPPFALEDYGIPISDYFQFTLDFFEYMWSDAK